MYFFLSIEVQLWLHLILGFLQVLLLSYDNNIIIFVRFVCYVLIFVLLNVITQNNMIIIIVRYYLMKIRKHIV